MAFLTFLLNLIIFLLVLGVIILLHEMGHLIAAKRFGVLCHEYSIGMGPLLYKKQKGETQYSLRAIPLGGYVSMAGEQIDDELLKIGAEIGLNFKDGMVSEIVLTEDVGAEVRGILVDYELYDRDKKGKLYIEILVSDEDQLKYLDTLEMVEEVPLEDANLEEGVDEFIKTHTKPALEVVSENVDGSKSIRLNVRDEAIYRWKKNKKMQIGPKERALNGKPKWQQFIVMFAGPFMNFILAIILFFFAYLFLGKPATKTKVKVNEEVNAYIETGSIVTSVNGVSVSTWNQLNNELEKYPGKPVKITYETKEGEVKETPHIRTTVVHNQLFLSNMGVENEEGAAVGLAFGYAEKAGLMPGDVITEVNGATVSSWSDIMDINDDVISKSTHINLKYRSKDETTNEWVNKQVEYRTYPLKTLKDQGAAPYEVVILGMSRPNEFNFAYAMKMGFVGFGQDTAKIFKTLGALFTPKKSGLGVKDLSGPVGIFQVVGQIRARGFGQLLAFAAFLSINIGIINLFPIPALDGGRILFLAIEAIIRKPIPKKVDTILNYISFGLLIVLFIFVTVFDVFRLF